MSAALLPRSPQVPWRHAFGLGLATLVLASAAAGSEARRVGWEVVAEHRDGSAVTGLLLDLDEAFVRLQVEADPVTWPLADLIRLQAAAPAAPLASAPAPTRSAPFPQAPTGALEPPRSPAPDRVVLRRGGELVGRLVESGLDSLVVEIDGGTRCEVPLDLCDRILPGAAPPLDRLLRLTAAGDQDRLWRRRPDGGLDALVGMVERVQPDAVLFEGALGPLRFPKEEVVAVVLAPIATPEREVAGLPVTVALAGGSRLSAGLLALRDDRVELDTAFAGRLVLPLAALLSCVRAGAGAALLADLPVVSAEERPSFGGADDVLFPWRRNLSVGGQPLGVGGRPRATGLSVHAHATLRLPLPPGAESLRVTAGFCDEVLELPAVGTVRFEILVDGRSRVATGVLREGDAPVELRVDGLSGARFVELSVDDGGDDDAADRVAWVDGVVLLAQADEARR